ncbi:thioredoxin family protein [Methanomassiliicoccus luminyensis]|jgi:small redox-active disulfide protein 2|uniref:thioredoxin family protein n=1 Tax=Methanomassiliicoccus luminyensis TaxID=1080712 RepID=UPI000377E6A3|nr:thioredoxin family protein [Methanomassiliicoccus luminyensis]
MSKPKIEVLYQWGCGSCKRIEHAAITAVEDLGLDVPVEKLTDIEEAKRRGATQAPVLFINGKIAVQGRYPTSREIRELIEKEMRSGADEQVL